MKQQLINQHFSSRKKVEEVLDFYGLDIKGSRAELETRLKSLSYGKIIDFLNLEQE
jgi:hypothetical protein